MADSSASLCRHNSRHSRIESLLDIGSKLVYVVNQHGQAVVLDYASAHVADNTSQIIYQTVISCDPDFHTKAGDQPNLKVCKHGTWNGRMVVETALLMLTTVYQVKSCASALRQTWPCGWPSR